MMSEKHLSQATWIYLQNIRFLLNKGHGNILNDSISAIHCLQFINWLSVNMTMSLLVCDILYSFSFVLYVIIRFLIFSCDQAALWMVQSVCPSVRLSVRLSVCLSVRPSVCHTFLTMFPSCYHHEIFRSYYQWQKWRPCKRSRSEVKGQGHRGHDPNFRFRTVTPVWIHIWWWNDTYSLMLLRRGALLFFKVIRQISRSHGAKIAEFDPDWAFPDCNSSLNSPMATKWCTKLEVA